MIVVTGDPWLLATTKNGVDAIAIPVTGDLAHGGAAAMYTGAALAAARRCGPWLPEFLGARIVRHGSHAYAWVNHSLGSLNSPRIGHLVTFPVRRHNEDKKADLDIVEASAVRLVQIMKHHRWRSVVLADPSYGSTTWTHIQPVLDQHFDDRVTIVLRPIA